MWTMMRMCSTVFCFGRTSKFSLSFSQNVSVSGGGRPFEPFFVRDSSTCASVSPSYRYLDMTNQTVQQLFEQVTLEARTAQLERGRR